MTFLVVLVTILFIYVVRRWTIKGGSCTVGNRVQVGLALNSISIIYQINL